MAARPLASVLTESPGWTTVPVLLVTKAPVPWATEVVGWNTVSVAAALIAADAALLSQKRKCARDQENDEQDDDEAVTASAPGRGAGR